MVSDIEESLTGDQWGRSAIELANFGEILKLEDPNISSSLLFMTKHYTESNNLKFVPNSVSLISAFFYHLKSLNLNAVFQHFWRY